MDRFVLTLRPVPSDEALLRVSDAMQQVIDALKIYGAAARGVGAQDLFDWRLERASTNSPFTVVARAEPTQSGRDIADHVHTVSSEVSRAIRSLLEGAEPPRWFDREAVQAAHCLFERNVNGIGETDLDFGLGDDAIVIDQPRAKKALDALAGRFAVDVSAQLPERQAFGEIEGVLVAAGRYQRRPAVQIRSELYGFVWCVLSKEAVDRFGSEHTVSEVWEGKTVGIRGRLFYAKGGKLTKVEVVDMREIVAAELMDLDSVLDPDFTAGMDPHEYLAKMHNGELS